MTLHFTVLGWTVYASNARPYFSERNGFIKVRRIFGWKFGIVKR